MRRSSIQSCSHPLRKRPTTTLERRQNSSIQWQPSATQRPATTGIAPCAGMASEHLHPSGSHPPRKRPATLLEGRQNNSIHSTCSSHPLRKGQRLCLKGVRILRSSIQSGSPPLRRGGNSRQSELGRPRPQNTTPSVPGGLPAQSSHATDDRASPLYLTCLFNRAPKWPIMLPSVVRVSTVPVSPRSTAERQKGTSIARKGEHEGACGTGI